MFRWSVVALVLVGCRTKGEPVEGTPGGDDTGAVADDTGAAAEGTDEDSDGWTVEAGDCNDADENVYPGAPELCDGWDNACGDGWDEADEAGLATWFPAEGAAEDWTGRLAGSIEAPVEQTLSEDGELALCTGTWFARFTLEAESVTVRGRPDRDAVSVSAGGGRAFTVQRGNAGVTGLAVEDCGAEIGGGLAVVAGARADGQNLRFDGCTATTAGGAVHAVDAGLFLRDIELFANSAPTGGGVFLEGGEGSLSGIAAVGNLATGGDGGAVLVRDTELELVDCALTDNVATGAGGAARIEAADQGIGVGSCDLSGNQAAEGGALSFVGGSIEIASASLSENTSSGDGGALHLEVTGVAVVSFDELSGNVAGGTGGAIRGAGPDLTMVESTVTGNQAGGDGGAVAWDGPVSWLRAEFSANTATGDGGALSVSSGDAVSIGYTTLSENTAGGVGGAVHIDGGDLDCEACGFDQNAASTGGAVWLADGAVVLSETTFDANAAASGGAGLDLATGTTALTMTDGQVLDHTSGAAALVLGDAVLTSVDFDGNVPADVQSAATGDVVSLGIDSSVTCDDAGCAAAR